MHLIFLFFWSYRLPFSRLDWQQLLQLAFFFRLLEQVAQETLLVCTAGCVSLHDGYLFAHEAIHNVTFSDSFFPGVNIEPCSVVCSCS